MALIPCIILHGTIKGSTYEPGEALDDEKHYGEWNAVLIDEDWHLLDAFWGSKPCSENESENQDYLFQEDDNYFLSSPYQMSFTHLASVAEWQLFETPISIEEFESQALLKEYFFVLGLKLIGPKEVFINCSEEAEIKFKVPKEKISQLQFFSSLTYSNEDSNGLYSEYVFMQIKDGNTLNIRVRSPRIGTFKLEIIGKNISGKNSNMDWVAIYLINYKKKSEYPFPSCPNWGPGTRTAYFGLSALSHFDGEIITEEKYGELKVQFISNNGRSIYADNQFKAHATLTTYIDSKEEEVKNSILIEHAENGELCFHLIIPRTGQYALRLYMRNRDGRLVNFCNYLVTSKQKKKNRDSFPKTFETIDRYQASPFSGLRVRSHDTCRINTTKKKIVLEFENDNNVALSLHLSGSTVTPALANRLITEEQEGNVNRFKVRFPKSHRPIVTYGLRLLCRNSKGNDEVAFEYIVRWRKEKNKSSEPPLPEETNCSLLHTNSHRTTCMYNRQPEDNFDCSTRPLQWLHDTFDLPGASIEDTQDLQDLDTRGTLTNQDALHVRTDSDHEQTQLIASADFVPGLGTRDSQIFVYKSKLQSAVKHKKLEQIRQIVKQVKEDKFETQLSEEMSNAKKVQQKLRRFAQLKRKAQLIDHLAIAEVRSYIDPHPIVQRVIKAVLLVICLWKDDMEDWKIVQTTFYDVGQECIKRRIQNSKRKRLRADTKTLKQVLDLLEGLTLEQVRSVSAEVSLFYAWVKHLATWPRGKL